MKVAGLTFTRSRYPEIEGHPEASAPCWTAEGRWLYFDADWNTRFPFGTSACLRVGADGPAGKPDRRPGFTLDVNAPLGEPNRLYLWLPPWSATVSLPTRVAEELTGEEIGGVPVYRRVRGRWRLSDRKWLAVHRWEEKG